MAKTWWLAAGLAVAGQNAVAADADQTAAFEARIQQLEATAQQLAEQAAAALAEAKAARAELDAMRTEQKLAALEPVASPNAAGANGNAFNPAISLILDGQYAQHSLSPDGYNLAGFPLAGEAGPAAQGLSLGESEMSFAATIDDRFYGQFTIAVEADGEEAGIGVEEAYIDTVGLAQGLTLRGGRFFSNIGYLNTHHAHTDSFVDRPLAYQAFLGGQYGDDGVQLRWVAPTDTYLEVGGELLRGDRFPAGGAPHGGIGTRSLFLHAGGSVGYENEWMAGISTLRMNGVEDEFGFNGDHSLYLADFTWKWAPGGNSKDGGVTVRSEYFLDDRKGVLDDGTGEEFVDWDSQRRGGYLETVFRLNRRWETGYRYDRLWGDDSGPFATRHDPIRHSAMLTWRNSEYSLFRLQYSHERPNAEQTDDELLLQYQVALGAHGAHKF